MSPTDIARRLEPPHKVVMVAYPQAQVLDVVGPLEVFSRTERWLRQTGLRDTAAYETELVALEPGPVRMSQNLELIAHRSFRQIEACDTLLIAGGVGTPQALENAELLAWLKRIAPRTQRFGSVCTGALILARAGLLSGQRATTHWGSCDELAALAPDCQVERDAIFVESGRLFTSAGVTAGIDLALELVARDLGKATALAVAQELVVYRKRPGGQSQFSRFLEAERRGDRFGELQLWMLDHLNEPLPLERLAAAAGMSPRHLTRRFKGELGLTPSAYVARLRLEEARRRLEAGVASLKDVARTCGFADEQNLRRSFRRHMGVAPRSYRERFSA
jgi:transcriptional regulator GlxA family with amidase domain